MESAPRLMEETNGLDHFTVVTKTAGFSKGATGLVSLPARKETEIIHKSKRSEGWYYIDIFLNGNGKENSGYVCVRVSTDGRLKYFDMACIISVVDSSGYCRFPQTFAVSEVPSRKAVDVQQLYFPKLGVSICADRYIARKTLLDEGADLLQGDTLTLNFEIYNVHPAEDVLLVRVDTYKIFRSYFKEIHDNGRSEFYLYLNSPLAKALAKESEYFQRVLENDMIKKTEKCVKIVKIMRHEYTAFLNIARYLFGTELLEFPSITEIIDMFVVADKYLIPIIEEVSLCFLRLCLTDHNADSINFLCRNVEDIGIWERLDSAMCVYWGGDEESGEEEVNQPTNVLATTQKIRDRVWTYKHNSNEPYINLSFEIADLKTQVSIKADDEDLFDFLK